ncbi:hypothetical protein D9M71_587910 [compost metagenome]
MNTRTRTAPGSSPRTTRGWAIALVPALAWHVNMALAHSGVTSKASWMQPSRLLRAHRHALKLITSLHAAGAGQAWSAWPGRCLWRAYPIVGDPPFVLVVIPLVTPLVTGLGTCVDVRARALSRRAEQHRPIHALIAARVRGIGRTHLGKHRVHQIGAMPGAGQPACHRLAR